VTRLRARRPRFDSRQGQGIFLFFTAAGPALGPIQPLCNGTTHLQVVPTLIRGDTTLPPVCLHGIVLSYL